MPKKHHGLCQLKTGLGMVVHKVMGQTRFVDPIALVAYCPRANHGLTGGFLLLRHFSVAIFVSSHVCFI